MTEENINITISENSSDINITIDDNYNLLPATEDRLGGIKVDGTSILVDENGMISASAGAQQQSDYAQTDNTKVDYIKNKPDLTVYATNNSLNLHVNNTLNPHSITASQVGAYTTSQIDTLLSEKVDKVFGKGLSTEDYTTTEKNKLSNIQDGAEANINSDWNSTSGDSQILNKPDIYTKIESNSTFEYKLPSTPINPETKFLNANKEWTDISIGNGGYAANLYFSTEPSDISGYYKIDYALQATETELSATLNNQELLLRTYLYDDTIGITTIDAGAWVVSFTAKVSSSLGETYLKAEVFLRHIDNSETTLFSAYSPELNNTDYLVIKTETNQSSFACLTTDRLGIRIYGKTTSTSDITINTIIGDGRASYFTAPLRLRHNQLRDLNVDNNYLHVTNTEKSVWDSKQDTLTAGTGISIIDNIVSNTQTSANWGNITGTLSNQTDLKNALDSKQNLGDYATNTSLNAHTSNTSNPHSTTASQVGAYTSSQTDTLLSNKVDKIDGKGLSTNDFTNALLTLLNQQSGINTGDQNSSGIAVDTTNFSNNLSPSENTVQKALDKLDDLVASGVSSAVSSVNSKTGTVTLTTADIADGTDKRYITDAQKTVLQNTSGMNTGDQDLSPYQKQNTLKVNPLYTDDFSQDLGAYELPSYSTATYSIANGTLSTKLSSGNFLTSTVRNKYISLRNIIAKVNIMGVNLAQIHLRVTDNNNFITPYFNGVAGINVCNGGSNIGITSSLIPSYSSTNNYTLCAKLYENFCSMNILYQGNVVGSIENSLINYSALSGTRLGLGSNSTSVNEVYDSFSYSKIDEFINVIALGDSLTQGYQIPSTKDIYPNLLKTNYLNYPIEFTNKGVGGNNIAQVANRLGTDVFAFNIPLAKRNIVLLMIGTNDVSAGTAVATIFSNWETLVNNIKKFGFEVWAITNPPRDDNATYRTNVKALNALILGSSKPDKIIDFYSACVNSDDTTKTGYLYSDNLHLTATSDAVLAGLIETALNAKFNIS